MPPRVLMAIAKTKKLKVEFLFERILEMCQTDTVDDDGDYVEPDNENCLLGHLLQ